MTKTLQPRAPRSDFQTRLILKAARGRAADKLDTYGKTKGGQRAPKPVTLATVPLRSTDIKVR